MQINKLTSEIMKRVNKKSLLLIDEDCLRIRLVQAVFIALQLIEIGERRVSRGDVWLHLSDERLFLIVIGGALAPVLNGQIRLIIVAPREMAVLFNDFVSHRFRIVFIHVKSRLTSLRIGDKPRWLSSSSFFFDLRSSAMFAVWTAESAVVRWRECRRSRIWFPMR